MCPCLRTSPSPVLERAVVFSVFSFVILNGGEWEGIFFPKKGFMGSSEPRYLNCLSQNSVILSLATILGLGPFLDLDPTCPWSLKTSPREECNELRVAVASHVWNDLCLLLPKATRRSTFLANPLRKPGSPRRRAPGADQRKGLRRRSPLCFYPSYILLAARGRFCSLRKTRH